MPWRLYRPGPTVVFDPVFQRHTETLCDTVDVVEVSHDLNTARDPLVVETMEAKLIDVLRSYRCAIVGEPLGEDEQRVRRVVEPGTSPIPGEAVHHLLIVDLIPEVV
jgi:hypothetical protein